MKGVVNMKAGTVMELKIGRKIISVRQGDVAGGWYWIILQKEKGGERKIKISRQELQSMMFGHLGPNFEREVN